MSVKVLKAGEKLDLLRRRADLTYGELADKSEVPEKNIERYCTGRGAPSAGHLLRIFRTLEIEKPLNVFDPEDFEGVA